MKNIIITVIYGTILGNAMPAFAVECHRACTQLEQQSASVVNDASSCDEVEYEPCEDGMIFASCVSCENQKAHIVYTTQVVEGCSYKYATCECSSCDSGCTSTGWTSAGTGAEKKVTASCDCGTCNRSTEYRCVAGYYGSGGSCSPCPDGGSSSAGSTSQSDCYVTSFSDSTGSGTYTGKCYYN